MPPGTIFSLVVLVLFIFGAFYARAFILKRVSGGQTKGILGNRNIAVLEHFAISKDRSFCLVKTAGKVYFVAFAAGSVTILDTFDAETFSQAASESEGDSQSVPMGDTPYARMTGKFANIIAKKMGKPPPYEDKK